MHGSVLNRLLSPYYTAAAAAAADDDEELGYLSEY